MIRPIASFAAGLAITIAVVWYLVTPEVVRELRTVLAGATWWALIAATMTAASVQWLRAWRFAIITSGALALPDLAMVRIAFRLNFLTFLLPFRLGELSYPVLMRHAYGQPVLHAAGVLLLARFFDLCSVGAILAGMTAALDLVQAPSLNAVLWAGAVLLAMAPMAFVLGAHALARWLAAAPRAAWLTTALRAAQAALGARRAQLAAIGISFAIWLVFGALAALAANAVASIPAGVALLGASAGNLAFALPFNGIAGLGPSQAAWAAVVNEAGIPWTDAVISALAVYAVTLASAVVFGGAAMLTPNATKGASQA